MFSLIEMMTLFYTKYVVVSGHANTGLVYCFIN